MRKTAIVTASMPPKMVKEVERWAKRQEMTRSEFLRMALRRYFEELQFEEAVRVFREERRAGTLRVLPPGGLIKLMD